jgi:hypothetical protein
MEDLWKLKKIGYRLNDMTDRAEYDHMLKRFRDEEKNENMKNLLYGQQTLSKKEEKKEGD